MTQGKENLMPWYACLAALVLSHGVLLGRYLLDLFQDPAYRWGWILIVVAAGLTAYRWYRQPTADYRCGPAALLLLTLAMLVCAATLVLRRPPLALVSISLGAMGLMIWRAGLRSGVYVALPCVLLLLLVRPTEAVQQHTQQHLRQATVATASRTLEVVGIPHLQEGTTLETPERRVDIEQPRRSTMPILAALALAITYGIAMRQHPIGLAALALAAMVWTVITNAAAVALEVSGYVEDSWWFLGALLVAIGLLIVASDQGVRFLLDPIDMSMIFSPEEDETDLPVEDPDEGLLVRGWNWVFGPPRDGQAAQGRSLNMPARLIGRYAWGYLIVALGLLGLSVYVEFVVQAVVA